MSIARLTQLNMNQSDGEDRFGGTFPSEFAVIDLFGVEYIDMRLSGTFVDTMMAYVNNFYRNLKVQGTCHKTKMNTTVLFLHCLQAMVA